MQDECDSEIVKSLLGFNCLLDIILLFSTKKKGEIEMWISKKVASHFYTALNGDIRWQQIQQNVEKAKMQS